MSSTKRNVLCVLGAVVGGVAVGSVFSALMLYWHFPDAKMSLAAVFSHSGEAMLFAPLAMTIGIVPTFGFYGPIHGICAVVGMLMTLAGVNLYLQTCTAVQLLLVGVGCVLWANNNYLAFSALMSV